MRQLVRLSIAALGSFALAAAIAGPALAKKPHKKLPTLNLCAIAGGAVSSAQVQAPCTTLKMTVTPGKATALGTTASVATYGARWGTPSSGATPRHYASILAMYAYGSAVGVELFKHIFRPKVLGNGLPVAVGSGIASVFTDASSCLNPPTHQCVDGTFLALKGNWAIEAFLDNYPPTIPGAPELELPAQETAAKQLEEMMKPALAGIGQQVAGKV